MPILQTDVTTNDVSEWDNKQLKVNVKVHAKNSLHANFTTAIFQMKHTVIIITQTDRQKEEICTYTSAAPTNRTQKHQVAI
jgi:hypothetical protein